MHEDEENGRDEVAEKPEQPPKNRRGGNRFFTADEMENIPKALGVFVLIFVVLWLATVVALFIAGFTALTVFGIIKNNEWMLIGGAAGLIILFFIAYGAWFGRF